MTPTFGKAIHGLLLIHMANGGYLQPRNRMSSPLANRFYQGFIGNEREISYHFLQEDGQLTVEITVSSLNNRGAAEDHRETRADASVVHMNPGNNFGVIFRSGYENFTRSLQRNFPELSLERRDFERIFVVDHSRIFVQVEGRHVDLSLTWSDLGGEESSDGD
ncbi:hypothetical protein FOZ63_008033 [Perkinsus olseni]|uniref:Uncharacterized protein n=1 Tax=Perkinsus olseni TaxID=32597 RepID=A0A7J6PZK7_PEROL|nr:hypothetical protein FOZ63_008033 [Perkinsus olseni]